MSGTSWSKPAVAALLILVGTVLTLPWVRLWRPIADLPGQWALYYALQGAAFVASTLLVVGATLLALHLIERATGHLTVPTEVPRLGLAGLVLMLIVTALALLPALLPLDMSTMLVVVNVVGWLTTLLSVVGGVLIAAWLAGRLPSATPEVARPSHVEDQVEA